MRARVCGCVSMCGSQGGVAGARASAVCTNPLVQIPTSKSSLTRINTHTRNKNINKKADLASTQTRCQIYSIL